MIPFTLVSTVFNEIKRLDKSINEIERQSRKPAKINIVDAGSGDGTYEKLLEWKRNTTIPVDIISKPKCNVAEGRNIAIALATTELIVSTDFGCRYHPDWLESLVAPFEDDRQLKVAGGAFTVLKDDIVNPAQKADYVLQNGYATKMNDYFSVSSRSIAYKKEVWKKIGGYPESLTLAADDTIFWRQIKRLGFKYRLIDKPYVYWMRHQTFKGFGKEAGRYGLGDGESGINLRSYFSNGIETLLRYSLFLHLIIVPFYIHLSWLLLLFMVLQLAGLRSYVRAIRQWWKMKSREWNVGILFCCFWMIEVTRYNYLRGYTIGWLKRSEEQKELARRLRSEIS